MSYETMNVLKDRVRNMYVVFCVLLVTCDALSLRTVSGDKNVTKREAKSIDFYPDWVPFKNKHGDELGEFKVQPKAKPKKRLAPPVNFVLKAVEPEGDDYYEKGGGEDNYENKDWSDLNRAAKPADKGKSINHTDISDIDGVVNIITKQNPITEVLRKPKKQKVEVTSTDNSKDEEIVKAKLNNDVNSKEDIKQRNNEDVSDYDESSTEKQKPEQTQEQRENEAKKAKILNSVDELKERHANEQRVLTERLKEEEVYKEELERDKVTSKERVDKYGHPIPKHETDAYDDYIDSESASVEEKYKIKPLLRPTTSTKPPRRSPRRKHIRKEKEKTNKNEESGKLSVFKNPRAYMIFDQEEDSVERPTVTTRKPDYGRRLTRRPEPTGRYSSRYTTPSTLTRGENVRISLVPENNGKEDEPTLFFPKKRKNKRRRKNKPTAPPLDSYVAESVTDKTAKDLITAMDVTGTGNGVTRTDITSATAGDTSAANSIPSAADSASSAASAPSAVDAVSASSDHKAEKKNDNYHNDKGVDREHHSEHEVVHEEHGKKAYEGVHKDTKTDEGHHDKEDHLGKYNDHGGVDHRHHDEKQHYGGHHHEEHGKKHAKYEESGKHSKGHNTKGSHDIHKKEEYEKKVEFFEEDGDSSEEEHHGGHTEEHEHSSGGHYKKGNLEADYHGHSKGDKGDFAKGGHENKHKGHKASGGHDSHGQHGADQQHHGGKQSGKKWVYHHGHPAKTANLVIIDRRADRFQHGPQYYG